MKEDVLKVEQKIEAPISKIWHALISKEEMKDWYFKLDEFKPEKGFKFRFRAGEEGKNYLHECEIIKAEPEKELSYTWCYPEEKGNSIVSFKLVELGPKSTLITVEHQGLETFPQDKSNFAKKSFKAGWEHILGNSLKKHVED